MKTLSLLQPWATLVVMGAKKIETRSWNTKYRGELLIHASVNNKAAKELCHTDPFLNYIRHWTDLPYGAIIGKVDLISTGATEKFNRAILEDMIPNITLELWKQEVAFGDYSPGRYGWLLSDPVHFKTPTPAKGALSLWEFEEGLLL